MKKKDGKIRTRQLVVPRSSEARGILVQGLERNTLVAGKTTALKLYMSRTAPGSIRRPPNFVDLTITRSDGYRKRMSWILTDSIWVSPYEKLKHFYYRVGGAYSVGLIPGSSIPSPGRYKFVARLLDGSTELQTIETEGVFLPTKDLCVMVSRLWGQPMTWAEIYEAQRALLRFSILMPVRDGLAYLDGGGRTAGLRYNFDFNPYPRDNNLTQIYDRYLDSPHRDPIHLGISFRFPETGEGQGGNVGPNHVHRRISFSVIVAGVPLANGFCQESAHILGAEDYQSPHYDGDGHSIDELVDNRDAALGFDIQYFEPFQLPVYDVMYKYLVPPDTSELSLGFNSWDWEFLRQSLIRLNSTGP